MARTLTPDPPRATLAAVALGLVSVAPGSVGQLGALALGALAGLFVCSSDAPPLPHRLAAVTPRVGVVCLALYFLGLALAFVPSPFRLVALAQAFYRSGALVFGGGHVVLPLLQAAVVDPGFVSPGAFLAGYGAAQATPGPLFALSAYLGAVADGLAGAGVALVSIFLPGLLAMAGALPFWGRLAAAPRARAAMSGVNAAVVGLLAAALYDPVFVGAVHTPRDFALAAAGFVALVAWRAPPAAVVAALAGLGVVLG
jgi:chromate transporter